MFTMRSRYEGCAFLVALRTLVGTVESNFCCCANNPSRCCVRLRAVSYFACSSWTFSSFFATACFILQKKGNMMSESEVKKDYLSWIDWISLSCVCFNVWTSSFFFSNSNCCRARSSAISPLIRRFSSSVKTSRSANSCRMMSDKRSRSCCKLSVIYNTDWYELYASSIFPTFFISEISVSFCLSMICSRSLSPIEKFRNVS